MSIINSYRRLQTQQSYIVESPNLADQLNASNPTDEADDTTGWTNVR